MVEFVVNMALIAAMLALLTVCADRCRRTRQRDRRERDAERRLILAALTGAAAPPSERLPEEREPHGVPSPTRHATTAPEPASTGPDPASVAVLLDLLEDRHPARLGMFANLVISTRSVWSSGVSAGQKPGAGT